MEAIDDIVRTGEDCRVTDLSRRFGVSHVTVSRTVGRLARDGLVTTRPRQPIDLTDDGRTLAAAARRRHQTVVAFLKAIGVSASQAIVDAEGMEHHVSDETLRRMRAVIRDATPG